MEKLHKDFVLFEDSTQKAVLSIREKTNDYFELCHELINVQTNEVYTKDYFDLTRDELKNLGNWIQVNI